MDSVCPSLQQTFRLSLLSRRRQLEKYCHFPPDNDIIVYRAGWFVPVIVNQLSERNSRPRPNKANASWLCHHNRAAPRRLRLTKSPITVTGQKASNTSKPNSNSSRPFLVGSSRHRRYSQLEPTHLPRLSTISLRVRSQSKMPEGRTLSADTELVKVSTGATKPISVTVFMTRVRVGTETPSPSAAPTSPGHD